MSHSINYPIVKTYFIARSGDIFSHGSVDIDTCMTTGLDEIETFDNEQDYVRKLKELNITEERQFPDYQSKLAEYSTVDFTPTTEATVDL